MTARFLASAMLIASLFGSTLLAQTAPLRQRCQQEADAFLLSTPQGLQHRQTQAVLAAIEGSSQALQAVRQSRSTKPELLPGVEVREVGSTLTLYRPAKAEGPLPLLIYLHGGGWAFGSRNSCARYCMAMAAQGVAVLAVEYPLAPEQPFPAALDACCQAFSLAQQQAVAWGVDPTRISLGGDSAGGNLSLATALRMPKMGISSLVLFYPVVRSYADSTESWLRYASGYGLDAELMDAFNLAYAAGRERHPLISPAHASDEALQLLPPVLLVAAEHDILYSQGHSFAQRLSSLGVETAYQVIPGTVHLFITVPGQPTAFAEAVERSSLFLKR